MTGAAPTLSPLFTFYAPLALEQLLTCRGGQDSLGLVSDWSRSQMEHSDWSKSRAWQVLPISTRCGMLGEVLARSAPAYVGQIAAIFHNKNEKGFKLLNNWKFGFSVRLAWFSGIHISYSFSNGLDAKKLQVYWNFSDRANTRSSKHKVQRPSLKLVSGPIRAQHRFSSALIGPDTNIREGLQTWGLLRHLIY